MNRSIGYDSRSYSALSYLPCRQLTLLNAFMIDDKSLFIRSTSPSKLKYILNYLVIFFWAFPVFVARPSNVFRVLSPRGMSLVPHE